VEEANNLKIHLTRSATAGDLKLSQVPKNELQVTIEILRSSNLDARMRRGDLSQLRNQNSSWMPRLRVDLGGSRRGQPSQFCCDFGQRCGVQSLPRRKAPASRTAQSLPHCTLAMSRRKKTKKSWAISNLSFQPTFSLWSKTQKSMPSLVAWGSLTFTKTGSPAVRCCSKPAPLVTRRLLATWSSHGTHLEESLRFGLPSSPGSGRNSHSLELGSRRDLRPRLPYRTTAQEGLQCILYANCGNPVTPRPPR